MENQDKCVLNNLYDELQRSSIPKFPNNNELGNWIEDLIEADTALAGLLASRIGGEEILKRDLPDLEKLEASLMEVQNLSLSDQGIYVSCEHYLRLLKKIRKALEKS